MPKEDVVFRVQILCLDQMARIPSDELNAKYEIYDEILEVIENGLVKYQLGDYTSYEKAKSVRAEMLEKGIEDAFIAPYRNGVRINISDAFE